ncbi:hypothetical protein TCAL_06014 [Tigriopus californicus]|uniref:BZIP domain-containing protein n=1 Tax=Tigriopus californicus TaxID=6832 RepID=A0A553PP13_TIGCA|nr:hypothetical protein TCAL_06014 [Tigriopus californicus]
MANSPSFSSSHSLDGLGSDLFPSFSGPGQDPMLSSTLAPDEPSLLRPEEPRPAQEEDILQIMAQSLEADSDQVSDVVIHYLESDSEAGDQDGEEDRLSRPQSSAMETDLISSAGEETEDGGQSIHQDHDYLPAAQPSHKPHRRGKKRRKPLAHAWSQMKRIGVLQEKKPLYELESFEDPILERCRKNALGAKLNREKKKLEQERIKRELDELRHHNRSLMRRAQQSDARAMKAEQELARMRSLLENRQMSDIVKMSSCSKRHTSLRSREQCVVCSKGN